MCSSLPRRQPPNRPPLSPLCPGGLTLPKAEPWSSSAKPCKVRKQNARSLPAARSQIWGTASRKGWMLKMSILPWTFLQRLTWKEPMPHTLYLSDTQVIWESPGSFLRKASVNPSLAQSLCHQPCDFTCSRAAFILKICIQFGPIQQALWVEILFSLDHFLNNRSNSSAFLSSKLHSGQRKYNPRQGGKYPGGHLVYFLRRAKHSPQPRTHPYFS